MSGESAGTKPAAAGAADFNTDLKKDSIGILGVTVGALGFNAPAWIAATTIPLMYAVSGQATPLTILFTFLFPMLVLCFCFIALVRGYPSAGGVFTFTEKLIHPQAGTLVGWVYAVACTMIVPLTAITGSQYLQVLIPPLASVDVKWIAAVVVLLYAAIGIRGVTWTIFTGTIFLTIECLVVVGTGLMGVFAPHHPNVSFIGMYNPANAPHPWLGVLSGVLLGIWLLANFDSAIQLIEEARRPVITVQKALLLTLFLELVIYSIAAIGWQYAVGWQAASNPPAKYQGVALSYIADQYLTWPLSLVATVVVITSSFANMQMSLQAAPRISNRMAKEGHLPSVLARVHQEWKSPWVTTILVAVAAWTMIAIVGGNLLFYINSVGLLWVISYSSAALAFIVLARRAGRSWALALLPLLAMGVMIYAGWTSGPGAIGLGAVWIGLGVVLMLYSYRRRQQSAAVAQAR